MNRNINPLPSSGAYEGYVVYVIVFLSVWHMVSPPEVVAIVLAVRVKVEVGY